VVRRSHSLRTLDAQATELLRFRCTSCGNCCTKTLVPITGDDLVALAAGTGAAAELLVSFEPPERFDDGAASLPLVHLDEGPRVMCLRRRPDVIDGDVCAFHDGTACTVYEHRPVTCRLYPFLPRVRRGTLVALSLSDRVPCPYERDARVEAAELVADRTRELRQDTRWERLVAAWNAAQPGASKRAFFAYLRARLSLPEAR
jgi:Fe-S-cluster containining protein